MSYLSKIFMFGFVCLAASCSTEKSKQEEQCGCAMDCGCKEEMPHSNDQCNRGCDRWHTQKCK